MHIFEDSVISLGIFQLPMGATIPLHDHPGMTVISRCALPPAVERVTSSRLEMSCSLSLCTMLRQGLIDDAI